MHTLAHTQTHVQKNRCNRWAGWRDEPDRGDGVGERWWDCASGLKQAQSGPFAVH